MVPSSLTEIEKHYCVSLAHRLDRRKSFDAEMAKINLKVDFFDAVDGKKLNYQIHSTKHTPGMIGCFLSHHRIYEDAIANNYSSICVWEDDAKPIPMFNKLLERAFKELPSDAQFLFLGFSLYQGFYSFHKKVNNYWTVPSNGWGTQCYVVLGLDTIKTLYEQTKKMLMQIDEQLIQIILPNSGIKYYHILPNAVYQHPFSTDVQIQKS